MGIKVFNPAQCLKLRGTAGLIFDLGCSIDGSIPRFLLKVGFRLKVIDRRIIKFPARASDQNSEAPGANQEKSVFASRTSLYMPTDLFNGFQKIQHIDDNTITASNLHHVQDVSAPPGTLCWSCGEVFEWEEPWRGNGAMKNQL